ncbi:hypothetical protein AKJ64_00130 [candidate division MSBL1 archaeon SCGC-AAA259E17]|uniref:TRASH domain-containing protein n=1 Tax=candidate division MSBL1 archaeon SCGC-AAA259E17 TaxID=1698263 RepID=A0A133UHD2_9EURY|nr:hypothetical protein AKJ64_00130 [candidate division MSBL1 archaeon SCGC-AAA259E17]
MSAPRSTSSPKKRKGGENVATDPVCEMEVDPEEAPATTEYEGNTYYFCCPVCKEKFEKEPEKYVDY